MSAEGIARWRRLEDSSLYQLVKLKLGRMLHGATADSEDMDADLGVALSLLTLPGAFLSLLLFNKYGSLLHFLRGEVKFDPYAASLPDEYLFIVLAMLASGGVALWKWDTLFLDRRDTVNIVPLPIHTSLIFAANLLAILLFAAIFCADVNLASAVLFPLVVSASQESFLFFGKIALGHTIAILAASLFSFITVFAIAGLFLAILPARTFQVISLYLRATIAVALLAFASSAFTISQYIEHGASYSLIRYLPSVWFLGLCQWSRGDASSTLRQVAFEALAALILVLIVGAAAYALAYQRHFSRMAEISVMQSRTPLPLSSKLGRLLDRTLLRNAFEQAGLRFIVRTLARSDRHRAAVAVFVAVGFVAATQNVIWSRGLSGAPSTAEFAAPLIVLYCCILGLRFVFDIPVELNANWIFRFLIAPTLDDCATLAGKAIFLLVLPVIAVASIIFALRWGTVAGLLESATLLVLSTTLTAGLVLGFRKLPFTCARAGFRQNALLKVLLAALGVFVFAILPASIQHWGYANAARLLVVAPLLALVWWGLYEKRAGQLEIERQIVFDDAVQHEIELLNLTG